MKLRRICKAANSYDDGKCPAVYATDDPAVMVGQGKVIDAATSAELMDCAADEGGWFIPTETVLRAAGLFLSERGRPYALARFAAGLPLEIDLSKRLSRTRPQITAGRTKTTVRIVIEPPTAYTRLELTVYPLMAEAGEEVRIIAVPQGQRPRDLPLHDYWLFDEREVWRMHYYENFRFAGAELLNEPGAVEQHLRWRDLALGLAVPLQDYLSSREGVEESSPA